MKTPLLTTLLALTALAFAQDIQQVPAEQAAAIARKAVAALGQPADAPFAVDADTDKPAAIRASGDVGLLAMPDKKLTPATLAATGKDTTALGQLWMRNIVPAPGGSAPDPAKLRTIAVKDKDEREVKVEAYHLGIGKTGTGELAIAIYGRDKEPLLTVPLVKTDAPEIATPITLDGHKEGENTGVLVITLFGSHKADVTVTRPRE